MSNEIFIKPKYDFKVPIDASAISPNEFSGKSLEEIKVIKIWEGNKEKTIGDLFIIKGNADSEIKNIKIILEGKFSKVRRIGSNMSDGEIIIKGSVGFYLGEKMSGGKILVEGNTDSWLGSKMKGGVIEVYGNAGDLIGAPYRGETKGMRGGTIIIHGNAGNEIGCWMMGGLIKVKGNCGLFPGIHMKNGTILIHGNTEGRCGALMKGGKVIILGKIPTILSSFTFEEVRSSVKANGEKIDGPFYVFTGDLNEEGSGKIFISTLNNTHLKFYEKYIE